MDYELFSQYFICPADVSRVLYRRSVLQACTADLSHQSVPPTCPADLYRHIPAGPAMSDCKAIKFNEK